MANSVVINYLVKVAGVKDVETLKAKLTNLTTSKGFQSAVTGVGISVGMAAWNALGNAVQQTGQWMADSIGVASDLSEAMNKAGVVFGTSADAVDEFAESSATALGISKRAAYEATGMFGNLFTTMGLGQAEAAAMSVDITKLAADLGSFHNLGIEEVFQKLRAGLVGEAEPMRQLGVMLNAATVEAKALAMGLADTKAEITESDKVMARYALILEQTGNAQGDFARTSDGLANSQKQLAAQMEDVQATVGEALIPVVVELADELETTLIPALQGTADILTAELPTGANTLGQALDLLGTPFNLVKDNANRASLAFRALQGDNEALISLFESMPGPMGDTGREMREASDAAKAAAKGASDLSAGLLLGKAAADKAAPAIAGVGDAADDTAGQLAELEQKIKDVARTARDESLDKHYDLSTIDDKIILAKAEVASARRELEEAETREQKAAARIRIAEAERELTSLVNKARDMRDDFGNAGRLLGKSLGQQLYNEVVRWNSLTRREIARLGEVRLTGPGSNSAPDQYRASGGPVYPMQSYVVGEAGPELFVPTTPGTIVPTGAFAPAPSPAPVNLAVYLDSEQIAARVERRQYFAASVAPVSAR